jgi:hydroxymethylpyrimidine pyrophosphatase-like HAD family hydrolase
MATPLRCVYTDLDGTLLGAEGSFLHDAGGAFSLLGARALEACARAGVEVVIYTGRHRATVLRDARTLGLPSYICEAGACVVLDGEEQWLVDGFSLQDGRSVREQIVASGAPDVLLERFDGRLEHFDPFYKDREGSLLFRGEVDAFEADAVLEAEGHGKLRLLDNGAIAAPSELLPGIERPHAYHLLPRAVSKRRGVAFHMRARGYAPEECIAVGDSREDLGAAPAVGTFWLVANALERDPGLRETLAGLTNVRVAGERNGAGVYEAVITELGERRG